MLRISLTHSGATSRGTALSSEPMQRDALGCIGSRRCGSRTHNGWRSDARKLRGLRQSARLSARSSALSVAGNKRRRMHHASLSARLSARPNVLNAVWSARPSVKHTSLSARPSVKHASENAQLHARLHVQRRMRKRRRAARFGQPSGGGGTEASPRWTSRTSSVAESTQSSVSTPVDVRRSALRARPSCGRRRRRDRRCAAPAARWRWPLSRSLPRAARRRTSSTRGGATTDWGRLFGSTFAR